MDPETVVLQSRGRKDFAVQEIDRGGATGITVELGQKREDGSQVFVVSLLVERLGHHEQTIRVKVKTAEGLVDLPLRMTYYGIPAQAVTETK